jgi:hypothetical protein
MPFAVVGRRPVRDLQSGSVAVVMAPCVRGVEAGALVRGEIAHRMRMPAMGKDAS